MFPYKNTLVYLVDTPGFDDSTRSDVDVLRELATWLKTASEVSVKLDGIIYLHRITDPRMGGSAARNLRMFKLLCGHDAYSKVRLATTRWEEVKESVGVQREKELQDKDQYWGPMMKLGSRVERHYNTRDSAMKIIETYLPGVDKDNIPWLEIQNEMFVKDRKELRQTKAGQSLEADLSRNHERLDGELGNIKKMLQRANTFLPEEGDVVQEMERRELRRREMELDTEIRRLEDEKRMLSEGLREYEKTSTLRSRMRRIVGWGGGSSTRFSGWRSKKQREAADRQLRETDRQLRELKDEKTLLQIR
jgi:hypothetical protein